ncbi:Putative axial regulator YABBY 2 [Zea mays]|uniref:Putative axial regulator YABBY 2 n=1 Tax=Zea mays TaxID=4577 RepID=A0A1D6MVD4_MAIZE|nr:Putative axial regulator YABBY 2 [Zea mays]
MRRAQLQRRGSGFRRRITDSSRKRYAGSKRTTPTLTTGKPSARQPRIGHIIQTSISV